METTPTFLLRRRLKKRFLNQPATFVARTQSFCY